MTRNQAIKSNGSFDTGKRNGRKSTIRVKRAFV